MNRLVKFTCIVCLLVATVLTACSQAAPLAHPLQESSLPATSTIAAPSISPLPTVMPIPTAIPVFAPPTLPVAPFTRTPRIIVLADHLNEPDDLIRAPDGLIYFSDIGDGTIKQLMRDGSVKLVLSRLSEPEGLVFLPDGSLVVVEQGTNRLLRYDIHTQQREILLRFENRTNQAGVDGLIYDAARQELIIPDSPNHGILFVDPNGNIVKVLHVPLTRPTGVVVDAQGNLIVADEFASALVRVNPDTGVTSLLARLPEPDDVVLDGHGNVCANTLSDGAIHCVNPVTGTSEIVVDGFAQPQGILVDGDGNLIVADTGHRRILKLVE